MTDNEYPCETCKIKEAFEEIMDMHWFDHKDCPLECPFAIEKDGDTDADNEIVKALECWINDFEGKATQFVSLCNAIDLINRQKETIEQLKTALFKCGEEAVEMQETISRQKEEIERLRSEKDNLQRTYEEDTKGKKNVKFKTGDKAKIAYNNCGHKFEIGTVVRLEKRKDNYMAFANGDYWWVTDDDLAEIDNDNLVKEFTEGGDGGQSLQEKLP